jgi:dipeptidase
MGASGWAYFVPYQTDISKALQELREAVFQRGEYHQRSPYWKDMTFEEFLPPDPDLTEEDKADYLAEFQKMQALPEPTSIETLIQWNAEDGTHSIIDYAKLRPHQVLAQLLPFLTNN